MVLLKAKHRGCDDYGCGDFGASRGSRTHVGVDFAAAPGMEVCSHVSGLVTKLGYPYPDDLSYRYVEITCMTTRNKHRFFYVEPSVEVGDVVAKTDVIGEVQDIASRYTARGNMKNHVHYEIKTQLGEYLDPEDL